MGNYVLAFVIAFQRPLSTLTDNQGNTYNSIISANSGLDNALLTKVATSAGTFTLSADMGAGGDPSVSYYFAELAGVDPTTGADDANGASGSGNSTAPATGNLDATTVADCALFGMVGWGGATTTVDPAVGSGWTEQAANESSALYPYGVISRGVGGGLASSTVDNARWVLGASRVWRCVAVSIRAAVGGGGGAYTPRLPVLGVGRRPPRRRPLPTLRRLPSGLLLPKAA